MKSSQKVTRPRRPVNSESDWSKSSDSLQLEPKKLTALALALDHRSQSRDYAHGSRKFKLHSIRRDPYDLSQFGQPGKQRRGATFKFVGGQSACYRMVSHYSVAGKMFVSGSQTALDDSSVPRLEAELRGSRIMILLPA